MNDEYEIARELLSRRYPNSGEKINPGVYALFIDDRTALNPLLVGGNGLLYVGMTADLSGERNHFELKHSGFSSPRRSLGALLKQELRLRACRRGPGLSKSNWRNYRFSAEGEDALTRWMNKHVSMNHVPLSGARAEIERVEELIIANLKPPLNLKAKEWRNPQAPMVEALREICSQEARNSGSEV